MSGAFKKNKIPSEGVTSEDFPIFFNISHDRVLEYSWNSKYIPISLLSDSSEKITLKSYLEQKLWPFKVAKFESKDLVTSNGATIYQIESQIESQIKIYEIRNSCIINIPVHGLSLRLTKNILDQCYVMLIRLVVCSPDFSSCN